MFKNFNPVKFFFYSFVLVVSVVGIWFYSNVLTYIVLSFFLAYFLNPFVRLLEKRGIPRTFAIIIIYLILISVIILTMIFIIPNIITQGKEFAINVSQFIETGGVDSLMEKFPKLKKIDAIFGNLETKLAFLDFDDFKQTILNKVKDFAMGIPNLIVGSIGSLVTLFTFLLIVPVVGFLLLKDQEKLEKFDKLLGTYLRALLIQIFIIGSLSVIALSIIGVNNALIIGIFAGLANAIPYLGPVIGIVFAVLSVIFSGKALILVVWVIASMLCVQLIDNIFVYPIVMGKNTEMHPLIILLTVVAGSYAYGIIGMLISVPLVFILKEMIRVLYINLKGFNII